MIEQMLDQLADFQAQADLLEMDKRRLLDEVKIPAEILAAQDEANKARQAIDSKLHIVQNDIMAAILECKADVTKPELPPEYAAALAAYRAEIESIDSQASFRMEQERKRADEAKDKIDSDLQEKIKDVYAQVEQRKRDIAAEFDGKSSGVLDNIAKLTADIKAAVKEAGKTVKGKFYQAVYVKGRVTWNTDMLDGMIAVIPQLAKARKEGEPSVTLRKV